MRATDACYLLVLHRADLLAAMAAAPTVAAHVLELLDLRDRPRRVTAIVAHHRLTPDGETITTLKDARRGTYYRLSAAGWFLWQRLDGAHTLRDLTLEYLQAFQSFAPDAIAETIRGLTAAGFVEGAAGRLRADVRGLVAQPSHGERVMQRARRLMEWYVPLRGVDAALTRLYRGGVWLLFTRPAQLVLALLALGGLVAFFLGGERVGNTLTATRGSGGLLLFLVPATILSVALHEAGHAFTTKAFGHEVTSVGVGWYWFGPVAYVDTSDMWLAGRGPRLAVNVAGLYTNLILAGIAALVVWWSANLVVAAVLWQFALSSYIIVLVNLNPLLELDGYFVLIDWLERPNLRPRTLAWLGNQFMPILRRRGLQGLRGHWLELLYGLASVGYLAVEVWLSVVLYRLLVQGWLTQLLPAAVATLVTWGFAVLVVLLTVLGILSDLRGDRKAGTTPPVR